MFFSGLPPESIALLAIAGIWSLIWSGIAMWKTARNNQLYWFIAILIINTLGILAIIYLLFFQKKPRMESKTTVAKKKKK
ncbi:hypothetical protein J4436_03180 [Candidatus Woesearchaeota archaeon]|nr:hypothetical protein [Candidatus Woesearchaeota archaeon]